MNNLISAEKTGKDDVFPASLRRGLARNELPGLNAVRACAAYLVVFYHFNLAAVPGGLGVLAFFVLSGFLITWLLLKEAERHGAVSLSGFYMRRALRIFPAFYGYSIVVLVLLLSTGKHIVWPQTWAALTYVNNYYQALHGDPGTAFSHTWSLAVEEQFYLLWPLLFTFFIGHPRRLGRVLAAVIAALWIHRWVLVAVGASSGYLYEAFDTRADHLLVGCLLAVALRNRWGGRLWSALCSHPAVPVATLGTLAASSAAANAIDGYRDRIGFVVDPLLVAVLIVQLLAFSDTRGWRLSNSRLLQYLGRISYSVYLYQQIVSGMVEAALKGHAFPLQLAAYVVCVTAIASASYWCIERPFLRLKERIGRRAHGPALSEPHLTAARA